MTTQAQIKEKNKTKMGEKKNESNKKCRNKAHIYKKR